jgi:Uri superfamily endonuclease
MRLPQQTSLTVGRLGRFVFPAGWYAYAGSARGPGGLAARVSRHRRSSILLRWHVDYLRAHAEPTAIWYTVGDQKRECAWATTLAHLPGARVVAPGFGASDCRCSTHLLHFATAPDRLVFASSVGDQLHDDVTDA